MYHLSTETTPGVAYVADCFQVPPWPGTVLPHRRLRPCVVRGWSTSAAVRRHQNPVRSTDSYCHRRRELCCGWPTCMEQSAAWTANVELYCLHLCGETKYIFIFGCQRVWELLKPRYINLHITLHLHYITLVFDPHELWASYDPYTCKNIELKDQAVQKLWKQTDGQTNGRTWSNLLPFSLTHSVTLRPHNIARTSPICTALCIPAVFSLFSHVAYRPT